MVEPYGIACIQKALKTVNTASNATEAKKIRMENVDRAIKLIDDAMSFWRWDTKIVVFPEFFLTGFPIKENVKEWMDKGCYHIPGDETDRLGEKAIEYDLYIVGNGYEEEILRGLKGSRSH